ncbi:MAG TPA: hypothetical protein VK779_02355 [Rhizomicrobium sp.]|jgi:hypothetical protein|nr:hypothetical protein [Rhizomicrobium sp.]
MAEKDKTKKPDLRDGLPGRIVGGPMKAEYVGDESPASDSGPDITKPGAFKRPAGQATQE